MHHRSLFAFFIFLVTTYHFLAYAVIFVAALFVGNLLSFSVLWIALHHRLGAHPLILVILTLFTAHLTGDILWYLCGKALQGTRPGNWIRDHLPKHGSLERHIRENSFRWIFMAEFLPYSAFPIFFMVGWMKVKFRDFFPAVLTAVCSSFSVLLILSYILVSTLGAIEAATAFRHLEVFFGIAIVLFLLLSYGITFFVKKEFGDEDGASQDGGAARSS